MAIDVKELLAKALLELCEEKDIVDMSIQCLLDKSGVSRQTFYNHFVDKNDLIQYVYDSRIIPDYNQTNINIDYKHSLVDTCYNMKRYHRFMKQACRMEGANCLSDYMLKHCIDFDLKWHQELYGSTLPSDLYFATKYHVAASHYMTIEWILNDMPISPEELANAVTKMREIGLNQFFTGNKPYQC